MAGSPTPNLQATARVVAVQDGLVKIDAQKHLNVTPTHLMKNEVVSLCSAEPIDLGEL